MTARRLAPPSTSPVASAYPVGTIVAALIVFAALLAPPPLHAAAGSFAAKPPSTSSSSTGAGASGLRLTPRLAQSARRTSGTDEPAQGEVYLDRVLDDSPTETPDAFEPTEAGDEGPLGPGRTVLGIDWSFVHERDEGTVTREFGTAASWQRETLDLGFLSAEIAGRLEDDGLPGDDDHAGGRISLRQDDFVLDGALLSDTALGDQIAAANPLLTRSFRFNLPASYLRGGGVRLHDDDQELRLQAGAVGDLQGDRLLTYDSTGATLLGAGYTRSLSSQWSGGLQYWSLRDDPEIGSHHTVAGALQYRYGDGSQLQLRALRDGDGQLGLWLDGDHDTGRWRHRYGLFRFERDLRWLDDGLADDRIGLYWRSDLRASRYDLSGGFDLAETNIDGDPERSGSVTASAFVRGTWLLRRDTQLGGSLDLRTRRDGSGLAVDEQNRTELSTFVSRRWALGTSRLQADTEFVRGQGVRDDRYELSLDHAWNVTSARLSTRLRTARTQGTSGDSNVVSLGTLAGVELSRDLRLTGDATASLASGEERRTQALRLGVGVAWQISRQWSLDVEQELVDQRERGAGFRDGSTRLELFARLRWSESSGRQPAVLGARGDTPGTGRIVGVVFLDENRDGLRSPGEVVVRGALLQLDGRRAETRTDDEGRYEFWPVFTGPHEVTLRTEELPLPWGLPDDAPVPVTVGARETVTLDFALVRLDQ